MALRPQHLPVSAYTTIGLSDLLVKVEPEIIPQPYGFVTFQQDIRVPCDLRLSE
jgi:hypothetical protein